MFNVQSKTDSLVYCTNQTKRLMEKLKSKTNEHSGVPTGSQMKGVGVYAICKNRAVNNKCVSKTIF